MTYYAALTHPKVLKIGYAPMAAPVGNRRFDFLSKRRWRGIGALIITGAGAY